VSLRTALRAAALLLVLGLAGAALARDGDAALAALRELSPAALVGASALSAVVLLLAAGCYRALLEALGSPLPAPVAGRIYLLAQLGKYVPGAVWPVVASADLAGDHGVPRVRAASAVLLQAVVVAVTALLLGLVALPVAPAAVVDLAPWALLLAPLLLLLLWPPVLTAVLDRTARLLRRPQAVQRPTAAGVAAGAAWAAASWTAFGGQVLVLAVALGAPLDARTAALALAGGALSWLVGAAVLIAPAGLGAREVALAAVLAGVLPSGDLIVLVLLSRVLQTAADVTAALLALGALRRSGRAQAALGSGESV